MVPEGKDDEWVQEVEGLKRNRNVPPQISLPAGRVGASVGGWAGEGGGAGPGGAEPGQSPRPGSNNLFDDYQPKEIRKKKGKWSQKRDKKIQPCSVIALINWPLVNQIHLNSQQRHLLSSSSIRRSHLHMRKLTDSFSPAPFVICR